jgi:hypothetical protein
MALQPQGIDILQMYTQDVYEDLPKLPGGASWQGMLVPFIGVVRDLSDLSNAKVFILQATAHSVADPIVQHGPYPTNGMQSWLQVGHRL